MTGRRSKLAERERRVRTEIKRAKRETRRRAKRQNPVTRPTPTKGAGDAAR